MSSRPQHAHASGEAADPGCFGIMLSCFLGDDNATAIEQSSPPRQKSATAPSFDETNTYTAEASLAGDSDFERSMPHSSSSSPLANIDALEEGEDNVGPFDEVEESTTISKLGEDSLVAGLEDTIKRVMTGHNNEDDGSNDVPAEAAAQTDDHHGQRNASPTEKSKSKKKVIGTASSLIRSLSSRRHSRRQSNDKNMAADSSNGHVDDINQEEVDEHEAMIDALVLDQEEPTSTSPTAGARSLDTRERSADNRFVIEYVKSEDNGTAGSDVGSDDGLEAGGYNAQDQGIIVPTRDVSAFSDRSSTSGPDSPLGEHGDEEYLVEIAAPIEVVLDESDGESVPSPPNVLETETETKEKGGRGKGRSKVADTLKRSVGSLRRVGSRAMQRTRSEKAGCSITQDLNETLQLDDTMPTSPDVSTASYRNSIGDCEYNYTEIYVDGKRCDSLVDDDDISDDSSSIDETSSERLRRRVVDVETRVQSQISQAKSFDSQLSQYALVHRSTSGHRGGIRSNGSNGEPVPKSQVIVDLGGHDGIITGGGYLETSDEVKKFKGMPLFVEQGIYDVIPARSADENSVVFIEAPATDPVTSGLIPYGSDEEDDIDEESYLEEEDSEPRKKSSKRRPLAFLRKKQRGTGSEIECK